MNFKLDKEQEMLKKSFSEFLSKECPFDTLREIKESESGYSKKIWRKISQLGWLGMVFEEKYDGLEGSFMDLFILFEEIGKVLLPSPLLFGNVLPGLMLQNAASDDLKDQYMPRLINGKAIISVALFDEHGHMDQSAPGMVARKSGDDAYAVSGTRLLVPFAPSADKLMVCADIADQGPTLLLVDRKAPGVMVTPVTLMTDQKSYTVILENVQVPKADIVGELGKGGDIIEGVLPMATALKCAEMIGGLSQVLDLTVTYAKGRKQFGRPIGSFQAVQHQCSEIAIFLDGAKLIAYQAAALLSNHSRCVKEVAMAKAWCSEAYKQSTWMGQQIHGGVGFTDEFNIHFFYKHAKESELLFGNCEHNLSKVADEMGI